MFRVQDVGLRFRVIIIVLSLGVGLGSEKVLIVSLYS